MSNTLVDTVYQKRFFVYLVSLVPCLEAIQYEVSYDIYEVFNSSGSTLRSFFLLTLFFYFSYDTFGEEAIL